MHGENALPFDYNRKPDAGCPTGFKQINPAAHKLTPDMQCPACDGWHLEIKNDVLANQKEAAISQLASQMIVELAELEPDLSIGQARMLAKSLATWAYNKGCRP